MIEAPTLNDGYTAATGHRPTETTTGYKHTEVGVIPEDWELSRIGGLARVLRGASPRPIDDPNWVDDESSTGWLRIADVTATDKYLNATCQKLSQAGIANSRLVLGDSLVMSICATVGKPIITRMNVCIHDGFVVFNNLQTEREYLYYVLSSLEPKWSKQGQTGSQMNLNTGIINSTPIPIPPPPEQLAIAEALSDVDKLLESVDALIAKKQAIKQAAMQELLTGRTRLPGFTKKWVTKPLSEVGDIRSGGTPDTAKTQFWDGSLPWCTPTDITRLCDRKKLIDTARTISDEGLHSSSAEIIPPRSLIMTSRATIGECAINLVPVTTNQGFKNIVTFAGTDVEFLYYLITTQTSNLASLCGGSTFLEIGKKQLGDFTITVPKTWDEQHAIASVLSDMDAEITGLEQRRDKILAIKGGMMQQLLTGRVRLAEPGRQPAHEHVAP